jgi:hypothetical protein
MTTNRRAANLGAAQNLMKRVPAQVLGNPFRILKEFTGGNYIFLWKIQLGKIVFIRQHNPVSQSGFEQPEDRDRVET